MLGSFFLGFLGRLGYIGVFLLFTATLVQLATADSGSAEALSVCALGLWIVSGYCRYLSRQTVRIRR